MNGRTAPQSKTQAEKAVETPAGETPADEGWIEVKKKKNKKTPPQPAKREQATSSPDAAKKDKKKNPAAAPVKQQDGKQTQRGAAAAQGKAEKQQRQNPPAQQEEHPLKEQWTKETQELKARVITTDKFDWSLEAAAKIVETEQANPNSWVNMLFSKPGSQGSSSPAPSAPSSKPLSLVGAVDLSFIKGGKRDNAVVTLVVLSFPGLEVVHEDVREVELRQPYVAGLLSFRETEPLVQLVNDLKASKPELVPQVVLVNTNSLLHKGFGLACHLGLLIDIPTIGVARKLVHVDGLTEPQLKKLTSENLHHPGEAVEVRNRNNSVLGAAMKIDEKAGLVYISHGHRIGLKTAVDVVRECRKNKLPEPIVQAEKRARAVLAKHEEERKKNKPAGTNNRRGSNNNGNRRNNPRAGKGQQGKAGDSPNAPNGGKRASPAAKRGDGAGATTPNNNAAGGRRGPGRQGGGAPRQGGGQPAKNAARRQAGGNNNGAKQPAEQQGNNSHGNAKAGGNRSTQGGQAKRDRAQGGGIWQKRADGSQAKSQAGQSAPASQAAKQPQQNGAAAVAVNGN